MRQHTLIDTYHDEETHAYCVTIGTDMGAFLGCVQCREEDYPHESQFFGFELAEIKAEIEYARAKRDHWNTQLLALNNYWRGMAGTRNYDGNAYWVKQLRHAVDHAADQRDYWVDEIDALKRTYLTTIIARDKLMKKLDKVQGVKND